MTLPTQQNANLADHSYGRDQRGNSDIDLGSLVNKIVKMEDGVEYKILAHVDKPSGYQGTVYQRVESGEIVVAHRGTEFGREPFRDGALADGGMVAGLVNSQAKDAIELTGEGLRLAQEYANRRHTAVPEVSVTGHSLGGTLAQITAHYYDLHGETFNAYGAASLRYRIPEEATSKVINNVMAGDVVSAGSPHYGQVRIFASQREITQLHLSGYHNNKILDALHPDNPILASVSTSHMMHNFLNVDGDYKPDVSALSDPAMPKRAADNHRMIAEYRTDVEGLRSAVTLGIGIAEVTSPALAHRAIDRLKATLEPPLPAGEPARLAAEKRAEHAGHVEIPPLPWKESALDRGSDRPVIPPLPFGDSASPRSSCGFDRSGSVSASVPIAAMLAPFGDSSMIKDSCWGTASREPIQPQDPMFARFRESLPPGTPDDKIAHLVLQTKQQAGISDASGIAAIQTSGNDVFVMGTTHGMKARLDLAEPAPPMAFTQAQALAFEQQQTQALAVDNPVHARTV